MSKCKNCDGKGFNLLMDRFGTMRKVGCAVCYGTGEVKKSTEQTNEEWFCCLSTKKKAEWFTEMASWIVAMNQSNEPKKEWNKWLKEKHNESV